jgi:glycosyltransferase involved in cell wall biosynthesis
VVDQPIVNALIVQKKEWREMTRDLLLHRIEVSEHPVTTTKRDARARNHCTTDLGQARSPVQFHDPRSVVGIVTDRDMRFLEEELNAAARGFLCPSLDEGFGLLALEAMTAGCPVAVASAGSLPEIAADAALVFDPRDPDAMAAVIDQICLDASVRAVLTRRGPLRARDFTWAKTAAAALTAYSIASAHFAERRQAR